MWRKTMAWLVAGSMIGIGSPSGVRAEVMGTRSNSTVEPYTMSPQQAQQQDPAATWLTQTNTTTNTANLAIQNNNQRARTGPVVTATTSTTRPTTTTETETVDFETDATVKTWKIVDPNLMHTVVADHIEGAEVKIGGKDAIRVEILAIRCAEGAPQRFHVKFTDANKNPLPGGYAGTSDAGFGAIAKIAGSFMGKTFSVIKVTESISFNSDGTASGCMTLTFGNMVGTGRNQQFVATGTMKLNVGGSSSSEVSEVTPAAGSNPAVVTETTTQASASTVHAGNGRTRRRRLSGFRIKPHHQGPGAGHRRRPRR